MPIIFETAPQTSHRAPTYFQKRSAGFIQGVILFGIALLAIVIAVFSSSNKSTSQTTGAEEAKTIASNIITAGNNVKAAADRFKLDRGSLSTITFDENESTGLFNTKDNFIRPLSISNRAFNNDTSPTSTVSANQNGLLYLRKTTTTPAVDITVDSNKVHLLTIGTLKEAVCKRINQTLHGSSTIPTAAQGLLGNFQTVNGNITINNKDSFDVAILEEGCVKATNGVTSYFYFKVLGRSTD